MAPTCNCFCRALQAPAETLHRLRGSEVMLTCTGMPALHRTSHHIEAEIRRGEHHYLVAMPLSEAALHQDERMVNALQRLNHPALAAVELLHDELCWSDDSGAEHRWSLLVQELPGVPFEEGLVTLSSAELNDAFDRLEHLMCKAGFAHNNLKAENLRLVGQQLIPIRYYHATVGGTTMRDAEALAQLRRAWCQESDCATSPCDYDPGYEPLRRPAGYRWCGHLCEGLICVEHAQAGFGYLDAAHRICIAPQFRAAEDFRENRAVVATEEGYGVIDREGQFILPAIFDAVEYDADRSLFYAVKAGRSTCFDYLGEPVSASKEPLSAAGGGGA